MDARAHWADITLYATGLGPIREWSWQERILGIQQAKRDAARQLEEKVFSLRTDSGETLFEKIQNDGKAKKKVLAYVRGAEVMAMENKAEGVAIHMRLFLGNPFKAALGLLPRKEIAPPSQGPHQRTRSEQAF